jgi:hypothetical protein
MQLTNWTTLELQERTNIYASTEWLPATEESPKKDEVVILTVLAKIYAVSLAYFIWKKKLKLMRSFCSLCVYPPPPTFC